MVAQLDNGSDLNIIHRSWRTKLRLPKGKIKPSDLPVVTSFSNNDIIICGKVELDVILKVGTPGVLLTFYIIPDIPGTPPLLLGENFLSKINANLLYNESQPSLFAGPPFDIEIEIIYQNPESLLICKSKKCFLEPYQVSNFKFFLTKGAPVLNGDIILVTSLTQGVYSIIPSRDTVQFNQCDTNYSVNVSVMNLSNKSLCQQFVGKIEVLPLNHTVHALHSKTIENAINTSFFTREILPSSNNNPEISCLQIHSLSIQKEEADQPNHSSNELFSSYNTFYSTLEEENIIEPVRGVELPTIIFNNAEEAVDLNSHDPRIRPFLKNIFIDKYPEVVSLHSMDAGDLSKTLGFTQLRLKPGESLPRAKRLYHICPADKRHLADICDVLISMNCITRTPKDQSGGHLYGLASYLVSRAKPGALGRLIVDFSPINPLLVSPPNVIPEIESNMAFLQGRAMFSSLDLRYAYMGIKIDEASRPLTTFLTPTESYQWVSLPTGLASSPIYFEKYYHKILNFEPVFDDQGSPIFEKPNEVKLVKSPLEASINFFDDIITATILKGSYQETLIEHFAHLEELVKRLHFHGSKVNVQKSNFCTSTINYLGWVISQNYCQADPRRIEKIKNAKFPLTKKEMRAFLGLTNSLRKVTGLDFIDLAHKLSPLTSAVNPFEPTDEQRDAFEKLKEKFTSTPLFCNLICPTSRKYLFVDAATSTGTLGAVLAQQRKGGEENIYDIPEGLNLESPIDQIIFDKKLPYLSVPIFTEIPAQLPKAELPKTVPPKIGKKPKLGGFSETTVNSSFLWSVISVLIAYRCKLPESIETLREQIVKKTKSSILGAKMRDFQFNLNTREYYLFLEKFLQGTVGVDHNFYFVQILSEILHRPIIIISTLERHRSQQILKFNEEADKPPIILGLLFESNLEIFVPYFQTKNQSLSLKTMPKLEVVAYMAKVIPPSLQSRPILELEIFALLTALHSFQKYISNTPCTVLTDSRVLYYLFHSRINESSLKIKRWGLKLLSDHSNVKLHFVKSSDNLADYLTRQGMRLGDKDRFIMTNSKISDFYDHMGQCDFTLDQWAKYVEKNPHFLKEESTRVVCASLRTGLENVEHFISPLEILQEKISRLRILQEQKLEFPNIIDFLLQQENFEGDFEEKTYRILEDLILIKINEDYKILMPHSLIGPLLALIHLNGHKGVTRMLLELKESYFFQSMYTIVKKFVTSCYSCFLSYSSSRKNKLGVYPTPSSPFEEIQLDLCENLNPVGGYSHLLIVQCMLTDFVIIIPLKGKSNVEVARNIYYNVIQIFNVKKLHSDNGPCFRANAWLELLASIGINVINSSALHPQGRGKIEKTVGIVKLLMRKLLATRESLDWELLPLIIAKSLNSSISPRTGFRPIEMVFGRDSVTNSIFANVCAKPHVFVKNNKIRVEQLTEEIKSMTELATESLKTIKEKINLKLNSTRTNKQFKEGDYVFALETSKVAGSSRTLLTKFNPSPLVVIKPLFTTTLVKRIGDGFTALYPNDSLKKYHHTSPLFSTLPAEIQKILLHDFKDLNIDDIQEITRKDNLTLPTGMTLFGNESQLEDEDDPQPGPSGMTFSTDQPLHRGEDDQAELDELALSQAQSEDIQALDDLNEIPDSEIDHSDSESESDSDSDSPKRVHFKN